MPLFNYNTTFEVRMDRFSSYYRVPQVNCDITSGFRKNGKKYQLFDLELGRL